MRNRVDDATYSSWHDSMTICVWQYSEEMMALGSGVVLVWTIANGG